jgi:dTMP kinase
MMDPERYFVVDGTQSVDAIHAQIIERVAELPALKRNAAGPHQNRLLRPIRFATNAVTHRIKK